MPLAAEITALEAELTNRGYVTAVNHYRQAIDGLNHGKYEPANSDLRSALEDLLALVRLAYHAASNIITLLRPLR